MTELSAFFSRIGLPQDTKTEYTPDFLARIQYAAVLSIPYENLDILSGTPLDLAEDALYDKIVLKRRGGYCFELNALLSHMLRRMGFSVRDFLARYLRGEEEIPFRRHRIACVTLGNEHYVMDIGVGQVAPRTPLLLKEDLVQTQGEEQYMLKKNPALGWVVYDLHRDEWRPYIAFTEDTQYEVDFVPPSFWCEKHPLSPFNKTPMLAIKTERGRKTMDGYTYKVFEGNTLVAIEENVTEDRYEELVQKEFGIVL